MPVRSYLMQALCEGAAGVRELSRFESCEGDAVAAQNGSITQLKTVERGLPPRSTFWRMTSGQKMAQIGRKIRIQ